MHLLSNKIFSKIKFLVKSFACLLLISCGSFKENPNKDFINKYGKNVSDINARRVEKSIMSNLPQKEPELILDAESSRILGISGSQNVKSAFVDTSNIKLPERPEEFLPNVDTFLRGRSGDKLPHNMFKIIYSDRNFPNSYRAPRLSFNDIKIPKKDAFGIMTALGDKGYILAGNGALQQDIDLMSQVISDEDRKASLELIRQEKLSRQIKYLNSALY